MMCESRFSIGIASSRSNPFPWGTPSMMSMSTTSHNSLAAIQCAAVAPTLPEPTTVTFLRMMTSLRNYIELSNFRRFSKLIRDLLGGQLDNGLHVVDHVGGELAGLHFGGSFQHAFEVVRDLLLQNGLLHRALNQSCSLMPAHKVKHHYARQDHRPWIDDIAIGILRCCSVSGLENGVLVANIRSWCNAQSTNLRRRCVRNVIAVQVRRRKNRILVRAGNNLLEDAVSDSVVDH